MLANASPSDKLSKRLQAIFAQASISRRDMLGAMIGAGMNIATAKSESFAVNELKQQYIDGYNNSSPNFEMEKEYQEHYFERLKKLVAEDEELKKLRKLQSKKAKIEQ